ncbi:uncharacterized protein L969DRAFT_86415 [Mixia osmundae IAM 14324]|uniref:DNA repair and recombination protein RAD54 n=1 Tax=Mixia osmundae (strain CBS 9802 / IAM 14324 / JCM 22182 / KY 12970) TaxID=764103 RepID=G7E985_MIXOS|nr:uncharacterized protein L969DRAFT_86415 [Mixia osmundae IAM 14324]KEI39827.1 hypothetical protein L969DRAFT_86415 [Mixia osmundae IAM 14324]GAA99204.1 hypothetical protein E5Q_05897 [Mixia osmundae IAM 14324]
MRKSFVLAARGGSRDADKITEAKENVVPGSTTAASRPSAGPVRHDANGAGFGRPSFKAFKIPSSLKAMAASRNIRVQQSSATDLGVRSRKKVDYAELAGPDEAVEVPRESRKAISSKRDDDYKDEPAYAEGPLLSNGLYTDSRGILVAKHNAKKRPQSAEDEDEDEGAKKKKGRFGGEDIPPPPPRVFPKFNSPKPKPLEVAKSAFTIPAIRDAKTGETIQFAPSRAGALGVCRRPMLIPRPLHDPLGDRAIVLWDPTVDDKEAELEAARLAEQAKTVTPVKLEARDIVHKSIASILGLDKQNEREAELRKRKVPVVLDPRLGKVLRPHQVEGVKFLYKAATGMISEGAFGCIMADEMGLGKTLQCITLLFTLLKQSPKAGKGTIEKAIVVCPASLVRNWANEFVKWLGPGTINPLAIDGSMPKPDLMAALRQWVSAHGRAICQPVIIVSYETLRSLTAELGNAPIGLILCDEAHRLKNATNLTYTELDKINVQRRVLLTGTPVQNDLTEYFSLLNFAIPGKLGARADFKKNYELAIVRGRMSEATDKERERCQEKLKELTSLVNQFVIRRTNDLLTKYLPVKYEHVVFCNLSPLQLQLYQKLIKRPEEKDAKGGTSALGAIQRAQKLCNHPQLLDAYFRDNFDDFKNDMPDGFDPFDRRRSVVSEYSGKTLVLDRFLEKMRAETNDKIVLISNYTETLDVFEKMLRDRKYGYFRLEGSTSIKKRQKLVDEFNNPEGKEFVFLLSSKAGGCGINLIGANRLILFDPDWNPAADQQALARVWRDGQKKDCFVYRFIATGTIEEKIFQRQAHKQALSSCVVDAKEDAERHFSRDDLKQLFAYKANTISETHDTFKCKRCKDGRQSIRAPAMLYGDTSTWNHMSNDCLQNIHDDLLRAETGLGAVSAVFQFISS